MNKTLSRRSLIQSGGLVAAAFMMPSLSVTKRIPRNRILVVCHLCGGNDGLNTVVPYRDPRYYALRPTIGIAEEQVLKIDHQVGFHPALAGLKELYREGKVAVVQNVGYEEPHRCHFRCVEAWHSGGPNRSCENGWLERHFGRETAAVSLGSEPPLAFDGASCVRWENRGEGLRQAAEIIGSSPETRAIYVSMSGFDTHVRQPDQHRLALNRFGEAVSAFQRFLEETKKADDVAILAYSEFGRSVRENNSGGTDHGAAGPVFLIGNGVKGGLYGSIPDLGRVEDGGLCHEVDFRQVYAAVLDQWLGGDSAQVLGKRFEPVDVFKA
jgi:uncharacterized protein (DUF1501 family)